MIDASLDQGRDSARIPHYRLGAALCRDLDPPHHEVFFADDEAFVQIVEELLGFGEEHQDNGSSSADDAFERLGHVGPVVFVYGTDILDNRAEFPAFRDA